MGKLNCKACSEKQTQSEIIKDEHERDNNADEQGEEYEEDINNKQVPIKNIPMLNNNAGNNINNGNGNDCVGLDNNINSAQTTHPNNPNDESNDNDNNNQLNEGDNDNENNVNTPTENNNPQQVHKQRKLPKKTKTLTSNNIMNRKMPLEIIDERHCETISPHRGGYYVSPYKHNPFSTMHNASDNVNPSTSSPNINSVGNFNNKEHNESNSSEEKARQVLSQRSPPGILPAQIYRRADDGTDQPWLGDHPGLCADTVISAGSRGRGSQGPLRSDGGHR